MMQGALKIAKIFPLKSNSNLNKDYAAFVRGVSYKLPKRKKEFKYFMNSPAIEEYIDDQHLIEEKKEEEVLKKQNMSGLRAHHYRIEHDKMPNFTEDELEIAELWKYRKYFGRYGNSSNIDKRALWPSTLELKSMKEREKVEFPYTVQEMIDLARKERVQEEMEIMERQEELKNNMKKLKKWMKDLKDKMNQKEMEARRFLEIKEKQIEDVRETLGYNISPHDPKFQEILEKKMEEDKKKKKKEKKLQKQEMELKKLKEIAQKDAEEAEASKSKEGTIQEKPSS